VKGKMRRLVKAHLVSCWNRSQLGWLASNFLNFLRQQGDPPDN
jgi:hypothetical protein